MMAVADHLTPSAADQRACLYEELSTLQQEAGSVVARVTEVSAGLRYRVRCRQEARPRGAASDDEIRGALLELRTLLLTHQDLLYAQQAIHRQLERGQT
jgi:hypothetical protein